MNKTFIFLIIIGVLFSGCGIRQDYGSREAIASIASETSQEDFADGETHADDNSVNTFHIDDPVKLVSYYLDALQNRDIAAAIKCLFSWDEMADFIDYPTDIYFRGYQFWFLDEEHIKKVLSQESLVSYEIIGTRLSEDYEYVTLVDAVIQTDRTELTSTFFVYPTVYGEYNRIDIANSESVANDLSPEAYEIKKYIGNTIEVDLEHENILYKYRVASLRNNGTLLGQGYFNIDGEKPIYISGQQKPDNADRVGATNVQYCITQPTPFGLIDLGSAIVQGGPYFSISLPAPGRSVSCIIRIHFFGRHEGYVPAFRMEGDGVLWQ